MYDSIAAAAYERPSKQARQLWEAARDGEIEKIKLLIADGANVNEKSWNNTTPLNIAIQQNHKEVVELLINNGANVNIAIKKGCKDIIELLKAAGAKTAEELK